MVHGEEDAADLAGCCADIDRGLAAIGADLEAGPGAELVARDAVQEEALVLGHEPLGGAGAGTPLSRHLNRGHGDRLVGVRVTGTARAGTKWNTVESNQSL